ncbi:uncharacterized protein [Dermacentor andersoni]|uniref:uncharacterized protein isoform X1 n=2 Tax=Dermacentor andersoni TaxID=34620 RepID=UPI003B3B64B0
MSTSHSRLWDTVSVMAEEVYHFAMTALCAYELLLDTYYGVKPKREISSVALSMALFIFHSVFLGRSQHSSMLPAKLVYLLDMLFHVGSFTEDAALVISLLHSPPVALGLETDGTRGSAVCNSNSILVDLVGMAYHIGILVTYYRWVQLRPATTTSCGASNCLSWISESVRTRLHRRPVATLDRSPLLGDAFERELPLDAQQICLPAFELPHHPVSGTVTKRRPAVQVSEHREGTDE